MIKATVASDLQTVWDCWTKPEHVMKWNHASSDWECPHAENDLRVGGRFLYTMAAKDGSAAFDFEGTYADVTPLALIAYVMDDGRKVQTTFSEKNGYTSSQLSI